MDLPSAGLIEILNYLLPGFVAAGMLFVLTPATRPAPFERIVQALIFTLLVRVGVEAAARLAVQLGASEPTLDFWFARSGLPASVVAAMAFGAGVAWITNHDKLHWLLRKMRITRQTSYPSEWYGAFANNRGYVVLHLTGNRRLYGWAFEWPSRPDAGHFVMLQAEWLEGAKRVPLDSVEKVIVKAADVEMVELMKVCEVTLTEVSDGRSEGAKPAALAASTP